jgi:hypothetical protein
MWALLPTFRDTCGLHFRIETNVVIIDNPIYFDPKDGGSMLLQCGQRILLPQGTNTQKRVQHLSYSVILVSRLRVEQLPCNKHG